MVYEWLKKRYMETGHVPGLEEIMANFSGMDRLELAEGIEEFNAALSWPGGQVKQHERTA
jgi:hypothetical protein